MAKSLPTPFNPPPPTTLLGWRHSFADAKRRGFGSKFYKFTIKFNEVSQTKFDLRYEICKYFEMDLNVVQKF